jgi:hypothetical protein
MLALANAGFSAAVAQGVTTGSITGTVTDSAGQPIESVQIRVQNPRTGYDVGTLTRASGFFVIQGIEPNSNYSITARRIGFAPVTRTGIVIGLGQTRREDFTLGRQAAQLSQVTVTAAASDAVINPSKTGTTTSISDSALSRLPTLNRNFADFVSLVPQVSTTTGYLSGGGVNLRQNAIQIDGAQSGDIFGIGTTGQPGASANAKSIPLDAVKEYQVLLSPFDVRQGGFGGLLINAVTKSGTNDFHGSVYGYTRDQSLTRTQPYLADYTQQQYGGTLGGPIIRDKLFFFFSGEAQRLETPALGSYIGSSDEFVSQASIDLVNSIMASKYGFPNSGSGGKVDKKNPNRNMFIRLDAYLPYSTRLVLRHNYASADNTVFSRGLPTAASPNFNLTSNGYELSNKTNSSVAQFLTNFSNGMYNEFLANYSETKDFRTVPARFPQITVQGVPRSDTTGTANFVLGTDASSQGNSLDQRTIEFTNNLTIPVGAHSITVGGKALYYKSINLFGQNSLGSWRFSNLDALNAGTANQYIVSAPAPTDPNGGLATIKAATYTAYIADAWQVRPTLSVNFGVRMDKPVFDTKPPLNPTVLTDYGRETSSVPHEAQFSPRFGFNWDITGDQRNQLRGGIGSFSGPTPFVYLSNAFGNSGLSGFAALTCNGVTTGATSLAVPAFNASSIATPPTSCAPATVGGVVKPGATIALGAAVNTIDPKFKNPKYLKATLGYDRRLAGDIIATIEGLYSRSQNNAFYQNLALVGPQGTDRNGRVLYGTLTATGATPTTKGSRTQVLDVTNASGDYTWSVTGQVQKAFTSNFDGSVAYTYQQSRDVVSITSSTAGSNFRFQRDVSGRLDDRSVSRSKYDQPHRIVATGSYRFKTYTDVSFIYTGNSGAPYDYVYGNAGGTTGDANADGQTQNDLMYVPKNTNDPAEILFTGYNGNDAAKAAAAASAQAFEKLISSTPCLRDARGTILKRNACRNPWINQVDVSIGQSLGKFGGNLLENVQVRLDVINFGNLLNKNWGEQAFSDQNATCGQICSATVALVHRSNVLPAGTTNSPLAQGVYDFTPTFQAFSARNASSNYRMQLSMRYSF